MDGAEAAGAEAVWAIAQAGIPRKTDKSNSLHVRLRIFFLLRTGVHNWIAWTRRRCQMLLADCRDCETRRQATTETRSANADLRLKAKRKSIECKHDFRKARRITQVNLENIHGFVMAFMINADEQNKESSVALGVKRNLAVVEMMGQRSSSSWAGGNWHVRVFFFLFVVASPNEARCDCRWRCCFGSASV